MKTLLEAKHPGQHINGVGGCHTRWANDGWCDGVRKADWLNNMGDDNETYLVVQGRVITNGDVRRNWLTQYDHLKQKD